MPSDRCFYVLGMPKRPSRIDLLELDIDLRLADLWRETADVSEWNLEVVAAFLRAAYGKGYCDALTEDAPGSLCHEHGYRDPGAQARPQTPRALACTQPTAARRGGRGYDARVGCQSCAARDRALGGGRARHLRRLHGARRQRRRRR